jgi:Raf kinase inhibitor-like YbhB/YbcL family protein
MSAAATGVPRSCWPCYARVNPIQIQRRPRRPPLSPNQNRLRPRTAPPNPLLLRDQTRAASRSLWCGRDSGLRWDPSATTGVLPKDAGGYFDCLMSLPDWCPHLETHMLPQIAVALTLSSPAFAADQRIPDRYSRAGGNVSPPIEWRGAPSGTRSYVLIVEDPDAPKGTFRHWILYNIPASAQGLAEGAGSQKPDSPMQAAVNDFGDRHYDGPQPPPGHGPHHYHLRLFALDVPQLEVPGNASAQDVLEGARAHALAQAEVVGTYGG